MTLLLLELLAFLGELRLAQLLQLCMTGLTELTNEVLDLCMTGLTELTNEVLFYLCMTGLTELTNEVLDLSMYRYDRPDRAHK